MEATQYVVLPVPSSKVPLKTQSFRDTRVEPVQNVKAFMNCKRNEEWKKAVDRNGSRHSSKVGQEKKVRSIRKRNGEKIVISTMTVEKDVSVPKWEREGYDSYNDYIRCRVHRGSYKA
jgi:hypothetical protein